MDRRDNDFMFSDLKKGSKNNQKKVIQQYREEKEQMKINKVQEEGASRIQKYLKGYQARMNLRKQLVAELDKNLQDLENFSAVVYQQKQIMFQLPIPKLMMLMRNYNIIKSLRKYPQKFKTKFENEFSELIIGLAKWVTKGIDSFDKNLLLQLQEENFQNKAHYAHFRTFLHDLIQMLPKDNKSGTLMNTLSKLLTFKAQLNSGSQLKIDTLLCEFNFEFQLLEKIRQQMMKYVELHQTFENISNEKKNMVRIGLKTALTLVTTFSNTANTNEILVALQYQLVNEILSIPTINKYFFYIYNQKEFNINVKNIYQSYYFYKKVDIQKEEEKKQSHDSIEYFINEVHKDERRMFVFSNTFEFLHSYLINELDTYQLLPILQVLEQTSVHLSRRIFDLENASIDDYIMTTILRSQLTYILDYKTTSKIFGQVFGEKLNDKVSIFEDRFNPQAAISLTKVYSTILIISKGSPKVFQTIILGIAFNEPVLFKLWKFIEVYCGIDSLLVRNVKEYDQYSSFIHSLSLFCLAFTRNLWVTSFEDFIKSPYFERRDVVGIVNLLKELIIDLIMVNKSKLNTLDEFVLYSASVLLRLLHEMFAIKDYVDPKSWDITQIKWKDYVTSQHFPVEIRSIISYMPECIPFDVRATFFQQMIKNDVQKNQHVSKQYVKIRRQHLFDDGFRAFSKINDLKSIVGVVFVNELGMAEEGQDAGGLFKEFLVDLSKIVFNPQYGLFLITEQDKELYPNAQSHLLFSKNDIKYFQFLGRLLGKAMYDGIILEPKFADFFLRKLIGKQNSLNDLKSLDFELFKHLSFLKAYDGNIEDLCLTFSVMDENEVTGEKREVDLIPGGSQVVVTAQNKFRYIYMMADFRLNRRIKEQSDAFVKGFHELIPKNWLSIFNERELQMMISGASAKINIKDLKKYTKYMGGYSSSDSKVKWFWKILEEFSDDEQSKLLKFTTSCPREPLMGFQYMHPAFTISKMDTNHPDEKLPTASTCFNILRLPPYSSIKIMKEKILYAINSNAGFELV